MTIDKNCEDQLARIEELERELQKLRKKNEALQSELASSKVNKAAGETDETDDGTEAMGDEDEDGRRKLHDGKDAPLDESKAKQARTSAHVSASAIGSAGDKSTGNFVSQLDPNQIERYSRQLLMTHGFGVEGQLKLAKSSVLIVGAGGIGSTVILYLAACGVGRLSIVDFDHVDVSNLHRQVIHGTRNVGMNKAESACRAVKELNPSIRCEPVQSPLTYHNALQLVSDHTCVVDASDNPQTRYLVNDACVLAGVPLVSGSAIGMEGQLTIYNHKEGPCYRCLYPKPSKSEGTKTCSDNGVLGPVPGTIGILQATETIKLITGMGKTMHDRLLMYDASQCSFLSLKKPPKKSNCAVCGIEPTICSMQDSHEVSQVARGISCDYVAIPLAPEMEISCADYFQVRQSGKPHVLLDVRAPEQFDICSLPGAMNMSFSDLQTGLESLSNLSLNGDLPVYCVCRRGIFSAAATKMLLEAKQAEATSIGVVQNITGYWYNSSALEQRGVSLSL